MECGRSGRDIVDREGVRGGELNVSGGSGEKKSMLETLDNRLHAIHKFLMDHLLQYSYGFLEGNNCTLRPLLLVLLIR